MLWGMVGVGGYCVATLHMLLFFKLHYILRFRSLMSFTYYFTTYLL